MSTSTASTAVFSVSSTSTVTTSPVSVSSTRSTLNATNTIIVGKRIHTFSASNLKFGIECNLLYSSYMHTFTIREYCDIMTSHGIKFYKFLFMILNYS